MTNNKKILPTFYIDQLTTNFMIFNLSKYLSLKQIVNIIKTSKALEYCYKGQVIKLLNYYGTPSEPINAIHLEKIYEKILDDISSDLKYRKLKSPDNNTLKDIVNILVERANAQTKGKKELIEVDFNVICDYLNLSRMYYHPNTLKRVLSERTKHSIYNITSYIKKYTSNKMIKIKKSELLKMWNIDIVHENDLSESFFNYIFDNVNQPLIGGDMVSIKFINSNVETNIEYNLICITHHGSMDAVANNGLGRSDW